MEPNLLVICDSEKLTEDSCDGAPDWTIEIASPSIERMDYGIKLFKYRLAGVREYWIVNPLFLRIIECGWRGSADGAV